MIVAIINDTHHGCRSDSDVFAKHIENFFKNVFWPYIDKNKIKCIIDLGDTFDKRKDINFKTLENARNVFYNEVEKRNIDLHIIAGNHTVYYKNTNELSILDTIKDLYPNNISIYKEAKEINIDGRNILLLPWINSSNYESSIDYIKKSSTEICLAHLELTGFTYQQGVYSTHGMSKSLFDNYQIVLSGHYHSKSDDGRIFYLGTQYDITWSDYGEKKYFHTLDTKTLALKSIENEDKIFVKLIYDDSQKNYAKIIEEENFNRLKDKIVKVVIVTKSNAILFDKFIDKITLELPSNLSIVDDTSKILYNQNSDGLLVNDTLTIVKQTIDDITTDLDKNRLFSLVSDLYIESLDD